MLTAVIVVGLSSSTSLQARADRLAAQLRCPVCQSESIADSTATTAREMRAQIDRFVAEGRTDEQILSYYEERYGRWIRLEPPLTADTLLLWGSPILALLAGILIVTRRRSGRPSRAITALEQERLRAEIIRARQREGRE